MTSPTRSPAPSASLRGGTAPTHIGPSKLRDSVKPASATVFEIASTRRPTERKQSSQGISSVPETYLLKNELRSAWLTASAAVRTPAESLKKRPFLAKIAFKQCSTSPNDAGPWLASPSVG